MVPAEALRAVTSLAQLEIDAASRPAFVVRLDTAAREPGALVPLVLAGRLFADVARASGRPELGLAAAAAVPAGAETPLMRRILRERTLGAAIRRAVLASSTFNTGQAFSIATQGGRTCVRIHYARALREGRQETLDYVLGQLLGLVRSAAGRTWIAPSLHCEGPPPRHAEQLAAFGHRIRFDTGMTAVALPTALLALPMPGVAGSIGAGPGSARVEPRPAGGFVDSVRQMVVSLLRLGSDDVATAAASAGMSVRSFQRHLAAHGLRFERVLDDVRFARARSLIDDPGLRIVDIAAECGYTDSANFTRAFRRWTGLSPSAYREAGTHAA